MNRLPSSPTRITNAWRHGSYSSGSRKEQDIQERRFHRVPHEAGLTSGTGPVHVTSRGVLYNLLRTPHPFTCQPGVWASLRLFSRRPFIRCCPWRHVCLCFFAPFHLFAKDAVQPACGAQRPGLTRNEDNLRAAPCSCRRIVAGAGQQLNYGMPSIMLRALLVRRSSIGLRLWHQSFMFWAEQHVVLTQQQQQQQQQQSGRNGVASRGARRRTAGASTDSDHTRLRD